MREMSWNLRKSGARRAVAFWLGGLFLMLAAYQLWGDNGYLAVRRKWQEQRELETRIEAVRRHNESLQKQIHQLRTDPNVIEKIAREELKLVRPEDHVIVTPQKK